MHTLVTAALHWDPQIRGALIVLTALVWRGLRMVGPLVTTPAVQSWVLATPIDRAGWLRPPFVSLLVFAGLFGAGVGLLAGWAGLADGGLGALWSVQRAIRRMSKKRGGPGAMDCPASVCCFSARAM